MVYAGIDVGSVAAKAVLLSGGEIVSYVIEPTGWSPKEAGRSVLARALAQAGRSRADIKSIVATGYGRVLLDFADRAVTEITCHALGAHYCYPENNLVIDIGGQDSKVIMINEKGKVIKFVMNDKCAAGTGRFLQVMALALGLGIEELNNLPQTAPVNINSMCTVFAESEVVSLLAAGESKERIVSGIYYSIARRISTMPGSLDNVNGVTFSGGVAKIKAMRETLAKQLGCMISVPDNPQIVGALGAAILAGK